jgi:hypothetical protein
LGIRLIFVIFLYYRTDLNLSNKICFIIFRVQMNPTQIFEFAMNWINQKIINLTECYWAETARPRCTVHDEPATTRRRCVGSGWGAAAHSARVSSGRDGGAVSEAVGTRAARARRRRCARGDRETGGRGEVALSRGHGRGGALLGRPAHCPDSGFKLRHVAATWARRGARRRTGGARCQWFLN